jgi:hypothetical protein
MAQPIWITPAGSLGTIPEGVFFQVPLLAYDPDDPDNPDAVYYEVIAGTLPPGIQCEPTGLIIGIPRAVVSVQGVPEPVSRDITFKFAARVYTERVINGVEVVDRLADRTFTLTITGQDAPEWITPAGQIAQYYDGSQIGGLQIQYTDTDPGDIVTVTLKAGSLPPGLTINPSGLISGFITPLSPVDATAGFSRDGQGYDEYPWDFSTRSVNTNYEFVLELSDGKSNSLRTFSIYVYSKDSMTADTTEITADNTFVTADVSPVRVPFIVSPAAGSIGRVRNDNFFAVQFVGLDLDGDQVEYELGYDIGDSSNMLPGLTLDPGTGWLYGYIPALGLTDNTYDFYVRVYKRNNPTIISNEYNYSLTIVGPIDTDVTWITDSNLGTINNGDTSTLYVLATNLAGISLQYQLESGSTSSLPQGLQLLPSGEIAGRVSFDTFALDLGSTTFDVTLNDLAITGENTETTFDMKHTFTVNAYSVNGLVSVFKDFTITVVREYNEPYENLYIQAMPPQNDRNFIDSLLQNQDIFQPELLYRPADPNFGRATNVVYDHAFGLTSATIEEYYSSLYENHYWKNLTLGEIRVAQALDNNDNVIYEVVYSAVQDNLLNNEGESVSKAVTLPYPVDQVGSDEITTVYPNSLINMRDQVIDTVGQISNILPRWMTSKQADGRVLGFTPAWVLAYTKPGKGEQIAYYIKTKFGERLNLIDFEVDRYELDRLLSKNWDPAGDSTTGAWEPAPAETTFDLVNHYQLPEPNDSSFVFVGGTGYAVGDRILILGSQVGGVNVTNNITITVEQVDINGTIEQAQAVGFAPLFSTGNTYTNVVGTNITGSGSGATWDIEVVGADATTFDGSSVRFIAPVDMYSNTQEYDRYLVFPYRTILAPVDTAGPVGWKNNSNATVAWNNNSNVAVTWVNNNT